jgi:general secretion pathway protein K
MRRSAGVALVTVMLVVALAALAATALLSSTSMSIHRTAALRDSEEGWWVAHGVEAWILGILAKDAKDNGYDGLDEAWAQPVDHLPLDEGFVRGGIVDMQGRFNLNNLSRTVDTTHDYERQFTRLLQRALPNVQTPQGLIAAIQDWIDDDSNPGPAGAEDSTYMELDPPYRAANQPFTVVSELLAVQGVTPEIYAALRDAVCVLPDTKLAINVNTADARVLAALSSQVDDAKLQQWISARKDKPVTDARGLQDFENQGVLGADAKPYLTYKTNYFQIQGEVFVGSSRVALYSLIRRPEGGNPTVVSHSADVE